MLTHGTIECQCLPPQAPENVFLPLPGNRGTKPLRLLPDCVVDPSLNGTGVQAIVVVMTATVEAAVAHIGNQLLGEIGTRIQKDSTTGISGANVAGYRPERPRLVDNSAQCRSSDTSLPIPCRKVERSVPVSRRRRAVSHNCCLHSFGALEPALLGETCGLDIPGRVC